MGTLYANTVILAWLLQVPLFSFKIWNILWAFEHVVINPTHTHIYGFIVLWGGGSKGYCRNDWRFIMLEDKREAWYKVWTLQITLWTYSFCEHAHLQISFPSLSPLSWLGKPPTRDGPIKPLLRASPSFSHLMGWRNHSHNLHAFPPSSFPAASTVDPMTAPFFLTSYHCLKIYFKVFLPHCFNEN